MKFISDTECLSWIASHEPAARQFSLAEQLFSSIPFEHLFSCSIPFPTDSGRKVAFARTIFHHLQPQPGQEILGWLRNWTIWPSSSHLPLLHVWRKGLGGQKPLEEQPGHLFGSDEIDDAMSLLVLSLEFFYDFLVFDSSRRLVCFVSHDEYVVLMSTNHEFLEEISTILKTFA